MPRKPKQTVELRDFFAGLVVAATAEHYRRAKIDDQKMIQRAYTIADKMMEYRKKNDDNQTGD